MANYRIPGPLFSAAKHQKFDRGSVYRENSFHVDSSVRGPLGAEPRAQRKWADKPTDARAPKDPKAPIVCFVVRGRRLYELRTRGGTIAHRNDTIEVRHNARWRDTGLRDQNLIAITAFCTDTPQFLQLGYVVIYANGRPRRDLEGQSLGTSDGTFPVTTDLEAPIWFVDGGGRDPSSPTSPLIDPATTATCEHPNGAGSFFDEPTTFGGNYDVWVHTFRTFVLCGGRVVQEVRWTRTARSGAAGGSTLGPPTYDSSVHATTEIPEWAKRVIRQSGFSVPGEP